jgi:hypothetical protein
MNCGGCGRKRLWDLPEFTGRNHEDVCQYTVSRYKYSQERYRLSHHARYNVGVNPYIVQEFWYLRRHSMLVRVASFCGVSWADGARVRGGVAATAWCRVLLVATAVCGLVDK